jgi:hypothetical protein
VLREDAVGRTPLLDIDGDGRAVNNLHQGAVRPDEITAFADGGIKLFPALTEGGLGVTGADRLRLAVIDGFREMEDGGGEHLIQIATGARQAGVGFAVWT